MILPIYAYGQPILHQKADPVEKDHPRLHQCIADMWETMHHANGCGLAAPQIGIPRSLFIVDSQTTYVHTSEEDRQIFFSAGDTGIMETFINARIIARSGPLWEDEEGCLSIPGLAQRVERRWAITIEYENIHLATQRNTFSGATARMIQHEYDHIQGVLFLDHLKPLSRKRLAAKLKKITRGQIQPRYPMQFV